MQRASRVLRVWPQLTRRKRAQPSIQARSRPASLQTQPCPRPPRAPAGTQRVPFQFAAHSGVRYSHGKSSLPWRCEPPNPRTAREAESSPSTARPRPLERVAAWGRAASTTDPGEREGEEGLLASPLAALPFPAPSGPGADAASGSGASGWGCRTLRFPPSVFQERQGICKSFWNAALRKEALTAGPRSPD